MAAAAVVYTRELTDWWSDCDLPHFFSCRSLARALVAEHQQLLSIAIFFCTTHARTILLLSYTDRENENELS